MEGPGWEVAVRQAGPEDITLQIHVEPGCSRDGVGPYDPWRQRIRVRVSAPATAGRANREVERLLAGALGVPKADVAIITGSTTRRKTVRVRGLTVPVARDRLVGLLGPAGVAIH
jgi:uncharacterized protein (TIGR00251 family)